MIQNVRSFDKLYKSDKYIEIQKSIFLYDNTHKIKIHPTN